MTTVDNTIASIASIAREMTYDDLPSDVRVAAVQLLVDTVGCAVAGDKSPPALHARELFPRAANEEYLGRVIGSGETTAADMAAFVNTAMIRHLDFNDLFPGVHPSECLGGLLAVGAAEHVSGRQLLTAMVVAYEVTIRVAKGSGMRERGWDQGAPIAVGLSAGLGNLLGMPYERVCNAVALATVSCVALRATRAGRLSDWAGSATGHAARESVFLTALARRGVTGPPNAFEGRHGVWDLISGPFELGSLPPPEGEFLTPKVRLKYWPVESHAQLAIWAGAELRSRIAVDDIESITVWTYWHTWHETGSEPEKWRPQTADTANHSFPYVFAKALLDGSVWLEAFEPDAYTDPEVLRIMQLMRVERDERFDAQYPETVAIRVVCATRGGETVEVELENPRGHDKNPMTPEETSEKFERLATPHLGAGAAKDAQAFWWAVESAPDVTEGLDLLTFR